MILASLLLSLAICDDFEHRVFLGFLRMVAVDTSIG